MKFIYLSAAFYNDYSNCKEIAEKSNRPYVQVCVKINGVWFAVPMRSHIKHPYALLTDTENKCGLDFTKAVVIEKPEYIDTTRTPRIRQNEFNALKGKDYEIKRKMEQFIRFYRKARKRSDVPRNKRICEYSALQYFEKWL